MNITVIISIIKTICNNTATASLLEKDYSFKTDKLQQTKLIVTVLSELQNIYDNGTYQDTAIDEILEAVTINNDETRMIADFIHSAELMNIQLTEAQTDELYKRAERLQKVATEKLIEKLAGRLPIIDQLFSFIKQLKSSLLTEAGRVTCFLCIYLA